MLRYRSHVEYDLRSRKQSKRALQIRRKIYYAQIHMLFAWDNDTLFLDIDIAREILLPLTTGNI